MRVLVLGGKGQVGTCLSKIRPEWTYWGREECDLLDYHETHSKIQAFEPEVIVNLAALVGSIHFNAANQESMFNVNLTMSSNILTSLRSVRKHNCRLIQILSSCMYGDFNPDDDNFYPLSENFADSGTPEETNLGYALAKRITKQAIDFNRSFGYRDCYLIPCNLMSEYDNFDIHSSHLVAALIRKVHYAKENGIKEITNFGDGTPLRQFMHAEDLAWCISDWVKYNISECVNVAGNENLSIKQITDIVLDVCDTNDIQVKWNGQMNGIHRKDICTRKLKNTIDWRPMTVRQGIERIYSVYKTQQR